MNIKKLIMCMMIAGYASNALSQTIQPNLVKQTGFFRVSFDKISMPNHIPNMGLLGINYMTNINRYIYAGLGGYGSVSGTQGGLFVLGGDLGLHYPLFQKLEANAGFFLGGGGGHSSLVGGGLMVKPYVGLSYQFAWARIGLHYSYINFPSGLIHSQQIGLDFDIPCAFYYVPAQYGDRFPSFINNTALKNFAVQRNDFGLLAQSYIQKRGTLGTGKELEDGTMGLVGAELDHYVSDEWFWFVKSAGAFRGVPNGYMDVLGGVGVNYPISKVFNVLTQFGIGAGGGGMVETGGGFVAHPQLGFEMPLSQRFAARLMGGYIWSPNGNLKAMSLTGTLIYHLNIVTEGHQPIGQAHAVQPWRISILNQTYLRPTRTYSSNHTVINLVVLNIDQLFTPHFYFTYQAASAYQGDHAGGLATGMIGPGVQSNVWHHAQLFANVLVGAAGGGSLAVAGGAVYEPLVGLNLLINKSFAVYASASQLKSFKSTLSTPVVNVGFSLTFGT